MMSRTVSFCGTYLNAFEKVPPHKVSGSRNLYIIFMLLMGSDTMVKDVKSKIQPVIDLLKELEADPDVRPYMDQIRRARKPLERVAASTEWQSAGYQGLPFQETPEYAALLALATQYGDKPFTSSEAREVLHQKRREGEEISLKHAASVSAYLGREYEKGVLARMPAATGRSRFSYKFTLKALSDLGLRLQP